MRLTLVLIVCLLVGCGPTRTTVFRDTTGRIFRIETEGRAITVIEYDKDKERIEQNTKQDPLINIKAPDIVGGKIGG